MAITMKERAGEREVGVQRVRAAYVLRADGGEDTADAWDYLATNAPAVSGLVLTDVDVQEVKTNEVFLGEAVWGPRSYQELPTTGTVRVSSRTSLQPVRIFDSRATSQSKAATWFNSETATDFGGSIGVDANGEVQGVDALVPVNVLSVEKILSAASVDETYQYATEQIVGHTNSAVYRSRAAGTLLCSGVTWNQVDDSNFSVNAEFMFEPNQASLTVGGISDITKAGWQYLWAYKVKRKVDGRLQPAVAQVNVETIYPSANFASILGF